MSARPIRIGFDARLAGSRHAGIGRYAEMLLRFLLTQVDALGKKSITWVIFVPTEHDMPWLEKLAEKKSHIELKRVSIRHYSLLEQLLWPKILWSAELDLLHIPHFNVPVFYFRPFTVTIHDLLWHQQRDPRATTLVPWMHRLKYGAYRLVSTLAIWRARYVFVPSKVVQKDVAQYTHRLANVVVTYEGVGEPYASASIQEIQTRSQKSRGPYCVYTGSLYPHKNVGIVLRALRRLPRMKLYVASARSVFTDRFLEQATRIGVHNQVEWLGYVSDEELISLYQGATAVIQPSLSEGFGLTGLEALATGTPVVAANRPIFHEIYKECAEYFSPADAYELSAVLERLQENPPSASERRRFRRHALQFDWKKTGEQTWQKMEKFLLNV